MLHYKKSLYVFLSFLYYCCIKGNDKSGICRAQSQNSHWYIFFSGGFPLPNISALANMGCKRFPGEVIYHRRWGILFSFKFVHIFSFCVVSLVYEQLSTFQVEESIIRSEENSPPPPYWQCAACRKQHDTSNRKVGYLKRPRVSLLIFHTDNFVTV